MQIPQSSRRSRPRKMASPATSPAWQRRVRHIGHTRTGRQPALNFGAWRIGAVALWRLVFGAWRLALGAWHSAWRLALGARRMALGAGRLALGAWRFGAWRMALGAWRLAHGAWRLAHGAWRMALGAKGLAFGAWRLPAHAASPQPTCMAASTGYEDKRDPPNHPHEREAKPSREPGGGAVWATSTRRKASPAWQQQARHQMQMRPACNSQVKPRTCRAMGRS